MPIHLSNSGNREDAVKKKIGKKNENHEFHLINNTDTSTFAVETNKWCMYACMHKQNTAKQP